MTVCCETGDDTIEVIVSSDSIDVVVEDTGIDVTVEDALHEVVVEQPEFNVTIDTDASVVVEVCTQGPPGAQGPPGVATLPSVTGAAPALGNLVLDSIVASTIRSAKWLVAAETAGGVRSGFEIHALVLGASAIATKYGSLNVSGYSVDANIVSGNLELQVTNGLNEIINFYAVRLTVVI